MRTLENKKNLNLSRSVQHGGGSVMVWGLSAASGPGLEQLQIVTTFHSLFRDPVPQTMHTAWPQSHRNRSSTVDAFLNICRAESYCSIVWTHFLMSLRLLSLWGFHIPDCFPLHYEAILEFAVQIGANIWKCPCHLICRDKRWNLDLLKIVIY